MSLWQNQEPKENGSGTDGAELVLSCLCHVCIGWMCPQIASSHLRWAIPCSGSLYLSSRSDSLCSHWRATGIGRARFCTSWSGNPKYYHMNCLLELFISESEGIALWLLCWTSWSQERSALALDWNWGVCFPPWNCPNNTDLPTTVMSVTWQC